MNTYMSHSRTLTLIFSFQGQLRSRLQIKDSTALLTAVPSCLYTQHTRMYCCYQNRNLHIYSCASMDRFTTYTSVRPCLHFTGWVATFVGWEITFTWTNLSTHSFVGSGGHSKALIPVRRVVEGRYLLGTIRGFWLRGCSGELSRGPRSTACFQTKRERWHFKNKASTCHVIALQIVIGFGEVLY